MSIRSLTIAGGPFTGKSAFLRAALGRSNGSTSEVLKLPSYTVSVLSLPGGYWKNMDRPIHWASDAALVFTDRLEESETCALRAIRSIRAGCPSIRIGLCLSKMDSPYEPSPRLLASLRGVQLFQYTVHKDWDGSLARSIIEMAVRE
jgi:hypothetical protein